MLTPWQLAAISDDAIHYVTIAGGGTEIRTYIDGELSSGEDCP